MPSATITVTNLVEAKEGRKTFEVSDQNGVRYKIYTSQRGLVMVGNTYDIQFKVNNFQGRDYNMVDSVKQSAQGGGVRAQSGGGFSGAGTAVQMPRPAQGKQFPDKTDEIMFVNIGLKEGIRAGQINVTVATDLINAVVSLRTAFAEGWKASTGRPGPSPQIDPEMNDEVPL